jgi:hypothetical protein
MEITSKRGPSGDRTSSTWPILQSPLNVDISLTVTDDKDFLGSGLAGENLDIVGDVFGRNLGIA